MKILVTGAKGQLGTEIRNIAANYEGCEFVFTDVEELNTYFYGLCLRRAR